MKFGKTESGAVWLDPAKTSPYKFFQFWLNTDDRDVERLLKFFTFFSLEEIAALMAEQARDPGKRAAQRRLAEEMTARVHGADVRAERRRGEPRCSSAAWTCARAGADVLARAVAGAARARGSRAPSSRGSRCSTRS